MARRICLACRTLLGEGESCQTKGHQAIDLAKAPDRTRLDDEVWGPDSRARQLREMAKGGTGGGIAGGILDGCSGCGDAGNLLDGCEGAGGAGEALAGIVIGILVVIIAAVVGALLWFLFKQIAGFIRRRMDKPKPHGALVGPPKTSRRVNGIGTVKSGTPITTPWRAGSCLAYAFELQERRLFGGGAMLRDAQTGGFEITLDDGRLVRVPAGRVRILGDRQQEDVARERMTPFLEEIDPLYVRDEAKPLFPYDHARALTIVPGDRIEILGEVTTSAGESASYRENAAVLTPVGVPVLRVRRGEEDPEKRVRIGDDLAAAHRAQAEEEAAEGELDDEDKRRGARM